MWSDAAKTLGAGVVALVVSLIGIRLQLGARERRIRRDLFEELELLRVLKEQRRAHILQRAVAFRVAVLEWKYQEELEWGRDTRRTLFRAAASSVTFGVCFALFAPRMLSPVVPFPRGVAPWVWAVDGAIFGLLWVGGVMAWFMFRAWVLDSIVDVTLQKDRG